MDCFMTPSRSGPGSVSKLQGERLTLKDSSVYGILWFI